MPRKPRDLDAALEAEIEAALGDANLMELSDPKIAEELQASAAILDDVGGTVEMDDRGLSLATELNDKAKSPDIPLRLLMMIVNARTTLSRVVLPAEPCPQKATLRMSSTFTFAIAEFPFVCCV